MKEEDLAHWGLLRQKQTNKQTCPLLAEVYICKYVLNWYILPLRSYFHLTSVEYRNFVKKLCIQHELQVVTIITLTVIVTNSNSNSC